MKSVMVVLTRNCNLSCSYCYENKVTGSEMSFYDVKEIIDKEFNDTNESEIRLFFFGGEPILCMSLIESIYYYVEEQYKDFSVTYAITTNGTLIHGSIQDWLKKVEDKFYITLSLDGTPKMNDANRFTVNGAGSFKLIDIEFFRQYKHCIVKMTISDRSFTNFAEGIIFIEKLGFRCKANFASGVDYQLNIEENKKLLKYNLDRLAEYYSVNFELPLCYMLDLDLINIHRPLDHKFRYCEAGFGRHCYGKDSSWYPCQGLMPMSVKQTNVSFEMESFTDYSIMDLSPCSKCSFIRICKVCYASNFCDTGDVYTPSLQTCFLNKACMLTSARIQYNRLKQSSNSFENLSIDNKELLGSIYRIVGELNCLFS